MNSSLSVLLAEDDLVFALILKTFLEQTHFKNIIDTQTEDEAVNLCKAINPDFIILDVHLEKGNGLNAKARIREFSENPILMLTGSTPNVVPELKGMDYLVKPFKAEDFLLKINTMISEHQQQANS